MRVCKDFVMERRQLETLQAAYQEHLSNGKRKRLAWLEMAIDGQKETVAALKAKRDEIRLLGGCKICRKAARPPEWSRCPAEGGMARPELKFGTRHRNREVCPEK